MSDVVTQKCAVCGVLKTPDNCTDAMPWTRIFGATTGNSAQPIQVFRPQVPGQPARPGNLNSQALDFCFVCGPKTTVDQLPGLVGKSVESSQ
jgi:hypothetical protein